VFSQKSKPSRNVSFFNGGGLNPRPSNFFVNPVQFKIACPLFVNYSQTKPTKPLKAPPKPVFRKVATFAIY
jgi:hypothetical protein